MNAMIVIIDNIIVKTQIKPTLWKTINTIIENTIAAAICIKITERLISGLHKSVVQSTASWMKQSISVFPLGKQS